MKATLRMNPDLRVKPLLIAEMASAVRMEGLTRVEVTLSTGEVFVLSEPKPGALTVRTDYLMVVHPYAANRIDLSVPTDPVGE